MEHEINGGTAHAVPESSADQQSIEHQALEAWAAQVTRDDVRWWTRWMMLQNHDLLQLVILGGMMGATLMLLALVMGGALR